MNENTEENQKENQKENQNENQNEAEVISEGTDNDENAEEPLIVNQNTISSWIPARLDRLPFSRFHVHVMVALGITWILDGLEVTIISVIGTILSRSDVLGISDVEIGLIGTIYISGAICGALVLGYLSDKYGRRALFTKIPFIYATASLFTAVLGLNFPLFVIWNWFIGFGIGGEYSSVNSTVDEFIPSAVRGRVNIFVNGSYWLGGLLGASVSLLLLNTSLIGPNYGWRIFFGIGFVLGIGIYFLRRTLPESPRWLMIHGRNEEAERIVTEIEKKVFAKKPEVPIPEDAEPVVITPGFKTSYKLIAKRMFKVDKKKSILGLSLMIGQAFFYNGLFFTYALVLKKFYNVYSDSVGIYLIFFCIGNFLGPTILGQLFDKIGRIPMISGTYILSGLLLLATSFLFLEDKLNAITQTLCWAVIFFVASAGASSAYLTVSEIFPLELRALAISFFYSTGTGLGGIISPFIFGALVSTKSRIKVFWGYVFATSLMVFAGVLELFIGVKSEGQSLEKIAKPLSSS